MTKFYAIVEEGSLSETATMSNLVVVAKGSPRPTFSPDGKTIYAIEGSVLSKPDSLSVVELRAGAKAPLFFPVSETVS